MKKQIYTYVAIAAIAAFFLGLFISSSIITGNVVKNEKECSGFFGCLFMKQAQEKVQIEEHVPEESKANYEEPEIQENLCDLTCRSTYNACIGEFEKESFSLVPQNYVPICTSIHKSCMIECTGEDLNEKNPTIYEEYALNEIKIFIEKNNFNFEEIETQKKIIVRHSTEGKLVPGEIEILDEDDSSLQDLRWCTISFYPPNGVVNPDHEYFFFHVVHHGTGTIGYFFPNKKESWAHL